MGALIRPMSLGELFRVWRPGAEFVAGGTDWVIKRRQSVACGGDVIDLSLLQELKGISDVGEYVRVGALESMTALHSNALVRKYASALADAAYVMGSEQIRNRATVGGNVANSSPAADTPAPLAALGAEAIVVSARGERRLRIEEIIRRNANSLDGGEVIKEFRIPKDGMRVSAFLKIGSRAQVSISRINLAVSARPDGGVYRDARVYVGTLGSAARKCAEAEKALASENFESLFSETLVSFAGECIPGRSTLPYKQSALRALACDICGALKKRAEGAGK